MADYSKTVWSTGDVITATLANHGETQYDTAKAEFQAGNWPIAANLLGGAHNTYDLGATATRWKDIYLAGGIYGPYRIRSNAAFQMMTEAGAAQSMYVKNIKLVGTYSGISSNAGELDCLSVIVNGSTVLDSSRNLTNCTIGATQLSGTIDTARLPNLTKTLMLHAAGLKPRTTSGCGLLAWTEMSTNKQMIPACPFDQTTEEYGQWLFTLPDGYTGGDLSLVPVWTANGSPSGTVAWKFVARCYTNDDALDQAFGSSATSTDTFIANNDYHEGPAATLTPGGTPAGGKLIIIQVSRDVANDTMTGDALLIGVKVEYPSTYSD